MSNPIIHNKRSFIPIRSVLVVWISLLLFASACDDSVDPFIGTELPYTIWGTLNPRVDTQAVRVFLIDDILKLTSPDPLDALVTIINTDNNQEHILADSVVLLDNGDARHIFWAEMEVDHFESYRIEVERSDGQVSKSADIQVPGPVELIEVPANTNAISELTQTVIIDGNPPSLPRIDVQYDAFTVNSLRIRQQDLPVTISYSGAERLRLDTLVIDLDLRADYREIQEAFDEQNLSGLICLDRVRVEVHVGNEGWLSPTGVFDPDFLVEPGTLTNIENGFGLFSAGFVEEIVLNPPDLLLVRAGFFDCVAPVEGG